MLTLDWSRVFTKPMISKLRYDVYVGSNEGGSDVHKVIGTSEESVTIALKKMQQLSRFYVYMVAIAPSGSSIEYRDVIDYN
jgi:hypothetical protein